MADRGDMAPIDLWIDATPEHVRRPSAPPHRDPTLELFGGYAGPARAAASDSYTGRHRAPDAQ